MNSVNYTIHNAIDFHNDGLWLPSSITLTSKDIKKICGIIRGAVNED